MHLPLKHLILRASLSLASTGILSAADTSWPPPIRGVTNGVATIRTPDFLRVPPGTYGMKVSADGSTIFVNLNGHPADAIRPAKMKPVGFGLAAFAAIHIPVSQR